MIWKVLDGKRKYVKKNNHVAYIYVRPLGGIVRQKRDLSSLEKVEIGDILFSKQRRSDVEAPPLLQGASMVQLTKIS